ncbi:hypothetical protein [Hwangdonia lutea]|uniref:Secreted protein n=1 Tax=Hwangdonia lutea TaxID=3075823 RepID=A0AA97EMQ3_9FLAO|nr:hypothetical protein [Hwangdonia sp. SCSIO 19198]WOD43279.1 hypothetical protein RNZ46_14915 [Hwangdonia sp. SCSIO 19198]
MKTYFYFLVLCFFALSANAQIDSKNKSTSIPAVESKKDSVDTKSLLPSKPIENNTINGMSVPKTTASLNFPKKEFSMFGEKFGNPGELYEDRFNKKSKDLKTEMGLGAKGSTTDQYFGDFKTKSKFVRVVYRDFGLQDGDYIRVLVNDEIIEYRVLLTNSTKGFRLDLKEGFNKIDFLALNEGYSMPNTAEFHVIDDKGNVIAGNQWNLSTGVKATIIVVKE